MTVAELIRLPKVIERKRRPQFKEEFRHYKMNLELTCVDSNARMTMFLRRLKDYPEDFTVGLKLDEPNEIMECDVVLLRYQGPHGGQSMARSLNDLHNAYHIHEYTEEDLRCCRKKASYKCAGAHTSFEEAIVLFLEHCNISDPNGIFKEEREKIAQIRLDFESME